MKNKIKTIKIRLDDISEELRAISRNKQSQYYLDDSLLATEHNITEAILYLKDLL